MYGLHAGCLATEMAIFIVNPAQNNTHDELPVHVSYIVNCFLSIHNIRSYAGTWLDGTACNEFS